MRTYPTGYEAAKAVLGDSYYYEAEYDLNSEGRIRPVQDERGYIVGWHVPGPDDWLVLEPVGDGYEIAGDPAETKRAALRRLGAEGGSRAQPGVYEVNGRLVARREDAEKAGIRVLA